MLEAGSGQEAVPRRREDDRLYEKLSLIIDSLDSLDKRDFLKKVFESVFEIEEGAPIRAYETRIVGRDPRNFLPTRWPLSPSWGRSRASPLSTSPSMSTGSRSASSVSRNSTRAVSPISRVDLA